MGWVSIATLQVTHGLTMRLILMHLAGWSPNTFHTVWNANNCDMYVLQKDLTLLGCTPYALAPVGDALRSSLEILVHFIEADGMAETVRELVERLGQCQPPKARPCAPDQGPLACFLRLDNYLDLPPPRTRQVCA